MGKQKIGVRGTLLPNYLIRIADNTQTQEVKDVANAFLNALPDSSLPCVETQGQLHSLTKDIVRSAKKVRGFISRLSTSAEAEGAILAQRWTTLALLQCDHCAEENCQRRDPETKPIKEKTRTNLDYEGMLTGNIDRMMDRIFKYEE